MSSCWLRGRCTSQTRITRLRGPMPVSVSDSAISNIRVQAELRNNETARAIFESLHAPPEWNLERLDDGYWSVPVNVRWRAFLLGWYASQETGGW